MNLIIWGAIIGAVFGAILSATRSDKDIPVFGSVIGFGVLGTVIGLFIVLIIWIIRIIMVFHDAGAQVLL